MPTSTGNDEGQPRAGLDVPGRPSFISSHVDRRRVRGELSDTTTYWERHDMGDDPIRPGHWPADQETLQWMDRQAKRYLGPDFDYLSGDVVSRVCEDWRFRESADNERARIETRLRSKAQDVRKSEQRRKARELRVSAGTSEGRADGELLELRDAVLRAGLGDEAWEIAQRVIEGYSIAEIERQTGYNRYKVKKTLEAVGRAVGLTPAV